MARIYIYLLVWMVYSSVKADNFGFYLEGHDKYTFSVELVHNLIVLKASINGLDSQRFILDSGAEANIIFSEILPPSFPKEILKDNIYIGGFGMEDSIAGKVLGNNTITIDDIVFGGHLYWIEVSGIYSAVSNYMGMSIAGILGIDFFRNMGIKVDYVNKELTCYASGSKLPVHRYKQVPIQLYDNKIFTDIIVKNDKEEDKKISVMIDMGESKSLVLMRDTTHHIIEPEKSISAHLGIGIGGDIEGRIFYYPSLRWKNFRWKKVMVAMPDPEFSFLYSIKANRSGSIGADILRRFTIIYDVANQGLYLKKNINFKDPYTYNRCGITLEYNMEMSQYIVSEVSELSPAYVFGIKPGDIILSVNHSALNKKYYEDVLAMMSSPDTKTLEVEILRNGVKNTIAIILFDRL